MAAREMAAARRVVGDTGSIAGGAIENLWVKRWWRVGAQLSGDEMVTVGIVGAQLSGGESCEDWRGRRALRLGLLLAIVDRDNVIESSHVDKPCRPAVFNTVDAVADHLDLHQPAMESLLARVVALTAKLVGKPMQG